MAMQKDNIPLFLLDVKRKTAQPWGAVHHSATGCPSRVHFQQLLVETTEAPQRECLHVVGGVLIVGRGAFARLALFCFFPVHLQGVRQWGRGWGVGGA